MSRFIRFVRAGDLKDLESQSLPFCVLQFMRLQMMRIFLTGVAINEAVELAKIYCSEEAPRFVNGVLAKLA